MALVKEQFSNPETSWVNPLNSIAYISDYSSLDFLTERGSRLSAGQRQLISFARALLADPKILILDEATSSIDTETEIILQKGLNELLKGRTSFIIAHRLSTIKNSSCIMYVDKGTILEKGTHDELMAQKGEYYKLYMSQYASLM